MTICDFSMLQKAYLNECSKIEFDAETEQIIFRVNVPLGISYQLKSMNHSKVPLYNLKHMIEFIIQFENLPYSEQAKRLEKKE